jgi:hypothetical protein
MPEAIFGKSGSRLAVSLWLNHVRWITVQSGRRHTGLLLAPLYLSFHRRTIQQAFQLASLSRDEQLGRGAVQSRPLQLADRYLATQAPEF